MANIPEVIILHHSWKPEDSVTYNEWKSIRNYHINTNGWSDIGYHYGIEFVDGKATLQYGRDEKTNGAHTLGMNTKSIGICVIGNYDNKLPDDRLIDVLVELIRDIYTRYGELPIMMHRDYAGYKSCPGLMFPIDEVRNRVNEDKHWANDDYNYLIEHGVELSEKRFDENITRGEAFALTRRAMESIYKSIGNLN